MTPLSPIAFALSTPCFACGAAEGQPCLVVRRTGNTSKYRDVPHFGRAGMPSARGWTVVALATEAIGTVEKEAANG